MLQTSILGRGDTEPMCQQQYCKSLTPIIIIKRKATCKCSSSQFSLETVLEESALHVFILPRGRSNHGRSPLREDTAAQEVTVTLDCGSQDH